MGTVGLQAGHEKQPGGNRIHERKNTPSIYAVRLTAELYFIKSFPSHYLPSQRGNNTKDSAKAKPVYMIVSSKDAGWDLSNQVPVVANPIPNDGWGFVPKDRSALDFQIDHQTPENMFDVFWGTVIPGEELIATEVTLAGQFSENNYMPSSMAFGSELAHTLSNRLIVAARGGWNVERDEVGLESGEKMRGMSFGGGIEYNLFADQAISIGYAYRDMGRLTENHVFTMMWKIL